MTRVRVATRASELALAQARLVAARLEATLGVAVELVPLTTEGDRSAAVSLAKLGGKGLFVKEIEAALLDGRADLAVHSAKDLPAEIDPAFELVAFPERADPRDALAARERGAGLDALPRGARVGTGSLRRTAQLRLVRPDLEVVPLRGNVPTRLRRLDAGGLDAIVLACAGLERLGLAERIDERLAPERMLPAVAQGALAVEARRGDPIGRDAAALDHAATSARVRAERACLARLGADCTVPLAALAEIEGGRLRLRALLASPDGAKLVRAQGEAAVAQALELGRGVAGRLLAGGGGELLAELRRGAAAAPPPGPP
jgi:hydroxymethylbilane synthase